MRAMVSEGVRFAIIHADAAKAHETEEPSTLHFVQSTAYAMDSFGFLLRTAACVTGAIQSTHNELLKVSARCVPTAFKGFKRVEKPAGPDDTWRNYQFDIAAMWMTVASLVDALKKGPDVGANALVHALQKARIWSLCTGLAGSASALAQLEAYVGPEGPRILSKVATLGRVLHSVYLRLWDIGFKCLNVKNHGSVAAQKRAIERMCSYAFVSSASAKSDVPDCGTATLVDNGPMSSLTAEQVGLVSTFGARECPCLGALNSDLNFSVFVGLLAPALTQTKAHLWAAVISDKVWVGQMDQGLPKHSDIERIMQWLYGTWTTTWVLTLSDMQLETKAFKKAYWRNQQSAQDEEIESILASMK